MSVIKKMLEKSGKLGLLGVLVFLIAECGVWIEKVEAGRNTKIIIKDTSKLRDALDRKLAEDNAKLDEKLEANEKKRKRLDKEVGDIEKEIMDFVNALPDKKD